jgi:hypothetical protein
MSDTTPRKTTQTAFKEASGKLKLSLRLVANNCGIKDMTEKTKPGEPIREKVSKHVVEYAAFNSIGQKVVLQAYDFFAYALDKNTT